MSTIYLDPTAMDATAGAIGEHAREVEDLVSTFETACWANVPAHLAGWLHDELHDIALTTRLSALLYSVAALDTVLRAQAIAADQSLVSAWPALDEPLAGATTTMTIGGDSSLTFPVSVPNPTTMTIGGDTSLTFPVSVPNPTTMTIGGDSSLTFPVSVPNPTTIAIGGDASLYEAFRHMDPSTLAAVTGVLDRTHDSVATQLAPNGLTVRGGLFVDNAGDTGTYAHVYADPHVPGRYEVRP